MKKLFALYFSILLLSGCGNEPYNQLSDDEIMAILEDESLSDDEKFEKLGGEEALTDLQFLYTLTKLQAKEQLEINAKNKSESEK